jgi:hypothetical protein
MKGRTTAVSARQAAQVEPASTLLDPGATSGGGTGGTDTTAIHNPATVGGPARDPHPGATSGGGTGGTHPPGMTPLDDWKMAWRSVKTKVEFDALNAKMSTPDIWGTFRGPEQKELLQSREAAKRRLQGAV